jgi:hypothetical protein
MMHLSRETAVDQSDAIVDEVHDEDLAEFG